MSVKLRLCKYCGYPISPGSKSGVCMDCRYKDSNQFSKGKTCNICGNRLVNWNKSGFCSRCRGKGDRAYKKSYEPEYTGVMGVCWKCGQRFPLRSDQYKCYEEKGMHWCPECMRSEDYKDFSYRDKVNQSLSCLRRNFTVNWFGD